MKTRQNKLIKLTSIILTPAIITGVTLSLSSCFNNETSKQDDLKKILNEEKNRIDSLNLDLKPNLSQEEIKNINQNNLFDYLINAPINNDNFNYDVVDFQNTNNTISFKIKISKNNESIDSKLFSIDIAKPNPPQPPVVHKPTSIKNKLSATDFGLNNKTVDDLLNEKIISPEFIFQHKNQIFTGENNITNNNQIVVQVSKNDETSVKLLITLKDGSWYNQNGELSQDDSNYFECVINDFNQIISKPNPTIIKTNLIAKQFNLDQKTANQVIDEKIINNEWFFANKNLIISGDDKINQKNQITISDIALETSNSISFTVVLESGCWYDENAELSSKNSKPTKVIIENFQQPIDNNQKYPTNLEELRKTDPVWLSQQQKYDSRQFNIVKEYVENQMSYNICWAFAIAAASETSILKEGINPIYVPETLPVGTIGKQTIDINEMNIDYITHIRTKETDRLGLNQDDLFKYDLEQGDRLDKAANALMQWNGVSNSAINNSTEQKPSFDGPFVLENYEIIPNKITDIKKAVSKYGSVAFAYNVKEQKNWEYLLAENDENSTRGAKHASAIIGWDDTIPKEKFTYYDGTTAKTDGAWIVRNSWGSDAHNNGYFYLSYESVIENNLIALDYANRSDYENNYYWDGMNNGFFNSEYLDEARGNEVSAVFPTLKASYNKKEYLKGVNATIKGNNITLDVQVYKNLKNKDIPDSGELVFSTTKQFEHSGCYTIELNDLIELDANSYYSVIMKATNTDNNAYVALNKELSKNDLTFYKDANNKWKNLIEPDNYAAKIKAFTVTKNVDGQHNNDIKYSTIHIDKSSARYDEINNMKPTSVLFDNIQLVEGVDYKVINKIDLVKPDYGIISDDQIIGEGTLIIEGINKYQGRKEIYYPIMVSLSLPPAFPNNLTYDKNLRKCILNVQPGITKYNQIPLPKDWEWIYPDQIITYDKVDNYLEYRSPDAWCYRNNFFDIIPKNI